MRERIFAIITKELSQLFRNRRTRLFLFVPPMFQLIIFGYAVNLDVDNLRMGWMWTNRRRATICWRLFKDRAAFC
jgi:ABC-2 type transport system permease protein